MPFRFGSDRSSTNQNLTSTLDALGNPIISSDLSFGASPLGEAARTQALYGIPNARFSLLPNDSLAAIDSGNPLPYWSLETSGTITATMAYDDTSQTWAVELDPTSAGSGDFAKLTTRTYLLNDSDLNLRQKAYASLTKVGTMATSQWAMTLTATYYDEAGTQLSSFAIGTVSSGSTWTGISGFTTSGTAVVNAAAAYADLEFALTASTAVTGTATVKLNSLLIQTSVTGGGSQSFLLTDTFTSSGTWTRPTGVDYVTVVGIGAGQGGQGGSYRVYRTSSDSQKGGNGGATGYYAIARDIYVGDVASVSVGIGAGGSGGTATTIAKPAGGTLEYRNDSVSAAGNGGDTTFGTYFTIAGARTAPSGFFGIASAAGTTGGAGGTGSANGGNGATHSLGAAFTGAPYFTLSVAGVAGGSAFGAGGTGSFGAAGPANATLGIGGGGGGGGGGTVNVTSVIATAGNGGTAGPAAGGGGGGVARYWTTSGTVSGTAGAGANAPANSGAGGGGGGGLVIITSGGTAVYNPSVVNALTGAGGNGGSGLLKVIYVG